MARFFALLLVLLFSHAASAAETKVGIFHSYVGKDSLGKRFNSFLSEQFGKSPKFREVPDTRQSQFDIYITTIDPAVGQAQSRKNLRTAYSYALTTKVFKADVVLNVYVRSGVGVCPGDVLEDCAADLSDYLADLVGQAQKFNPQPR